jgi:hypothetical protein
MVKIIHNMFARHSVYILFPCNKYGLRSVKSFRTRSYQLKPSSSIIENEIQNSLKWAFEEGYKLGRDDARDGIFIALDEVVDQFTLTMSTENVST